METDSLLTDHPKIPERNDPSRKKTSLRMKYEAEASVFRGHHGGLERVRESLGLSRRQICQLLLVDPSAWTRWSQDESRVPPHVYRALEWLLMAEGKYPGTAKGGSVKVVEDVQRRITDLEGQLATLKKQQLAKSSQIMVFFLAIFALVLLLILIRH